MMKMRSNCPINLAAEVLGDTWSLVILRDIMFGNRRSFRDILSNSLEGIATNILGAKLKKLVAEGLLASSDDPNPNDGLSVSDRLRAAFDATVAKGADQTPWKETRPCPSSSQSDMLTGRATTVRPTTSGTLPMYRTQNCGPKAR